MTSSTQASSDSNRFSSSSEAEEDIPIDLMEEAEMTFGTGLPPFIQKNLDPTIMPGDKHQVIPKTNNGTIPSIKSTKRVQLVCRAWNKNNSDRFWTYDHRDVRYVVKAFRTHAQPTNLPKIAYHVWQGMGGENRFSTTQIAFDADDRLYGPDTQEKFIPLGFGTIDTNKGLRTYADYLDYVLDGSKRSSSRRKSVSNLCLKALFDRDFAGDNDDERPTRRTRSMKQKQTTGYNYADILPITPLKSQCLENAGLGKCNDNFHGLRARLTGRRVVIKKKPSDSVSSCQSGSPKAVTKDREESRDSVPSCRNKPGKLSQDSVNQKAGGISNRDRDPAYRLKSSKALNSQVMSETEGISNGKLIHHIRNTRLAKSQHKLRTISGRENSVPKKSLPITKYSRGLNIQ